MTDWMDRLHWASKHPWVIVIIIVVVVTIPYIMPYYASPTECTVVVHEKWVKEGSSPNYFFSDEYGNVYSIEKSWLLQEYDMAERYAMIQEGKTYKITTYGWRIKCLAHYPNAVKIELNGYG